MSGCPSSLPGQGKGRGSAEHDLSKVDGSLKFILFFFIVKNPGYRASQVRCRPLYSVRQPDFQAVGGASRPLCCPVYLQFFKTLKINKLTKLLYPRKVTIGYLEKYPMVTCPSFHGYFALANIFLTFPDLTRHFFSYQREQQTPCESHPRKVDHQAKTVLFSLQTTVLQTGNSPDVLSVRTGYTLWGIGHEKSSRPGPGPRLACHPALQ